MDLDEYQERAHETALGEDLDVYLLGLIGEAGGLASAVKKYKRDSPSKALLQKDIQEEVGDVLWYAAEIARQFEIKLSDAARENLQKADYLFNNKDRDFSKGFPKKERFPKKVEMSFADDGRRTKVFVNGTTQLGDELTDNAFDEDGYRFHDVFHLSYMTYLGWSPVLRKLLNCKRRSDPKIDEIEDGARARVLEEGISILIFSQSDPVDQAHSLFSDRSNVPFWLIQNIKKMTRDLEVGSRSVSHWKDAISRGFRAFDKLRENGGGIVTCDLERRAMSVRKLPK